MKSLKIYWLLIGVAICDILKPKDNFKDINYEEDMGICSNYCFKNIYSSWTQE